MHGQKGRLRLELDQALRPARQKHRLEAERCMDGELTALQLGSCTGDRVQRAAHAGPRAPVSVFAVSGRKRDIRTSHLCLQPVRTGE